METKRQVIKWVDKEEADGYGIKHIWHSYGWDMEYMWEIAETDGYRVEMNPIGGGIVVQTDLWGMEFNRGEEMAEEYLGRQWENGQGGVNRCGVIVTMMVFGSLEQKLEWERGDMLLKVVPARFKVMRPNLGEQGQ